MTTVPNITYDQIYARLLSQLPPWFGNQQFVPNQDPNNKTPTTNFNNIVWAYLVTAMDSYNQFQYDFSQLRIGKYEIDNPNSRQPLATGDNLNLIAQDYLGNLLPRRPNESDDSYRNRILVNLISPPFSFPNQYPIPLGKATRPAMLQSLINLVSPLFAQSNPDWSPLPAEWYPQIYEFWYPADNGAYNLYNPPTLAFNAIGCYGTGSQPYTCNIIVFLPNDNGIGNHTGLLTPGESLNWGVGLGTYGMPNNLVPPMWYGSDSLLNFDVVTQDIINVIQRVKVWGTICNLFIQYVPSGGIPPDKYDWVDNLNNLIVDNNGNQIIFNVI